MPLTRITGTHMAARSPDEELGRAAEARAGRNPEMSRTYPPRTGAKPEPDTSAPGAAAHVAGTAGYDGKVTRREEWTMPSKSSNIKNEQQYEALKDKGMSKERAAKIANSPGASQRGGKASGSGGNSSQGGTTAAKKKAGRKGGKASHG
jgi:hypothetical protein